MHFLDDRRMYTAHTEFVPDDHLEDAPHFSIKTAYFQALVRNPTQPRFFMMVQMTRIATETSPM